MKYLVLLLLIGCNQNKGFTDKMIETHTAAKQGASIDLICYEINNVSEINGRYCIGYEGPLEKK